MIKSVPRPQVTISTESEKSFLKQQRKDAKKNSKPALSSPFDSFDVSQSDGDFLKQRREEELLQNASRPLFSNPSPDGIPIKETYPHVYQSQPGGSHLSNFGTQFSLPVGTERRETKNSEEISIPPNRMAPPRIGENLVMINTLDEYSQRAFRNYKSLNRVQSIVFPVAFGTNENMLVCAPTGAVSYAPYIFGKSIGQLSHLF